MEKRVIAAIGASAILIISLVAFSSIQDKKEQELPAQAIKAQVVTEETSTVTEPEYTEKQLVHIYVDPALYDASFESEHDYVPVYQTNTPNEKIDQLHRGTWVDFVSQTDTMIEIKTDEGVRGFIPLENGEISTVKMKAKPTKLKNVKIVLDAGHGGEDSGAISPDGRLEEKKLTLDTVNAVGKTLEDAGIQVAYSRKEDKFLSLAEITEHSLAENPDFFISIHYDDYLYANEMSGFTTYYYSAQNETMAETVNQTLAESLPLPNNGCRFGNYFVIREQYVPCLLLELGYLNSDADIQQVGTKKYQQKVADGILAGIKEIVVENKKS